MLKKELICISCPVGCNMTVEIEDKKVISVSGNNCKRGQIYAESEIINPVRMITTTVFTDKKGEMLTVKTNKPILKNLIFDAMKEIKKVNVKTPVNIGDIVLKNILGTDVDIVATRKID